jgi:hypothetical protein
MVILIQMAATAAVVMALLAGWLAVNRIAERGRHTDPGDCPTPHECGHCLMAAACHAAPSAHAHANPPGSST